MIILWPGIFDLRHRKFSLERSNVWDAAPGHLFAPFELL